jgi:hypothetical protein
MENNDKKGQVGAKGGSGNIGNTHPGRNLGSIFLGSLLVVLGLLFMARSLGWVHPDSGISLFDLWPLLVVGFGLSFLSGQGWVSSLFGLLITLFVAGLLVSMFLDINSDVSRGWLRSEEEKVSIPLMEGSERAEIALKVAASRVTVGSLYLKGDELMEGNLRSNFFSISPSSRLDGETQHVSLSADGNLRQMRFGIGRSHISLRLNRDIPITLFVEAGAADLDLDLADLLVEKLVIGSGASNIMLTLGSRFKESHIEISSGASSINISLPEGVGARVDSGSSFALVNVPTGYINTERGVHQSENFEELESKIFINATLGVASLNVTQ